MDRNSVTWSGPMPAVTTPFSPDGSIDEVGFARNVDGLLDAGATGVVAGGHTESSAARHNAQLLPATVLVSGDVAGVSTEREQLKDVAGRFKMPPRLPASSFAPRL